MNNRMNKQEAMGICHRYGVPIGCDFHTLNSDVVKRILNAADERKYRKPRNANGSRARYFYAYLMRAAGRVDYDCAHIWKARSMDDVREFTPFCNVNSG